MWVLSEFDLQGKTYSSVKWNSTENLVGGVGNIFTIAHIQFVFLILYPNSASGFKILYCSRDCFRIFFFIVFTSSFICSWGKTVNGHSTAEYRALATDWLRLGKPRRGLGSLINSSFVMATTIVKIEKNSADLSKRISIVCFTKMNDAKITRIGRMNSTKNIYR